MGLNTPNPTSRDQGNERSLCFNAGFLSDFRPKTTNDLHFLAPLVSKSGSSGKDCATAHSLFLFSSYHTPFPDNSGQGKPLMCNRHVDGLPPSRQWQPLFCQQPQVSSVTSQGFNRNGGRVVPTSRDGATTSRWTPQMNACALKVAHKTN